MKAVMSSSDISSSRALQISNKQHTHGPKFKCEKPEASFELIETQGVGLVAVEMNERLPNERGNTSVKAVIVSSLLFGDVVPQPSECGDRKVGRGFKSALMHGVVRECTVQVTASNKPTLRK